MNDTTRPTSPRPRQSPADLLGPQLILATQEQGYLAALDGAHVTTCPWTAPTSVRDETLQQMWLRGYAAGRTDLRRARTRPPS